MCWSSLVVCGISYIAIMSYSLLYMWSVIQHVVYVVYHTACFVGGLSYSMLCRRCVIQHALLLVCHTACCTAGLSVIRYGAQISEQTILHTKTHTHTCACTGQEWSQEIRKQGQR